MKKIKIAKCVHHIANDYDTIRALEPIADFYLVRNYVREWDEKIRPFPTNATFINSFDDVDSDVCIVHFDQQSLVCKNLGKYQQIREIKKATEGKKRIFINHSTPILDGHQTESMIRECHNFVGNELMVVNSYESAEMWRRGYPIIHGIHSDFWRPLKKRPVVCTQVSPAHDGSQYSGHNFLKNVKSELMDKYHIHLHWINTADSFTAKNINDYKKFIGKSVVYFNPTKHSPMPRSRTEAMLCGCCILTTPDHGADDYIKHGENGFLVNNNYKEIARLIAHLLTEGFEVAVELGKKARETAIKELSPDDYLQNYIKLFKKLKIL